MAIHTMTSENADYTIEYNGEMIGMKVSYEGCVLDTGEINMYDDSDFYAVVWDGVMVKRVTYGTTRFWSYLNSAKVDATPDVIAAAEQWLYNQHIITNTQISQADARKVDIDKIVRVVKGRKIAKGTIGKVESVKTNEYDRSNPVVMLSYEKDGKTAFTFTYMNNLEVVNPEQYELSQDEIIARAERQAKSHNWRGATAIGYLVI